MEQHETGYTVRLHKPQKKSSGPMRYEPAESHAVSSHHEGLEMIAAPRVHDGGRAPGDRILDAPLDFGRIHPGAPQVPRVIPRPVETPGLPRVRIRLGAPAGPAAK